MNSYLVAAIVGVVLVLLWTIANALADRLRHGPQPRRIPDTHSYVKACVDCGQNTANGATCIQCRVRRQRELREGKPVPPVIPTDQSNETDLSRKRGIMSDIGSPAHEGACECTDQECPPFPSAAFARQTAAYAVEWILGEQVRACKMGAPVTTLDFPDHARPEAFAHGILNLLSLQWIDLQYRRYFKLGDPQNALKAALVVPYWVAAFPRIGPKALTAGIPLLTTTWTDTLPGAPPETPSGTILAVTSNDALAPSLLLQNYLVESVHPFTTAPIGAQQS